MSHENGTRLAVHYSGPPEGTVEHRRLEQDVRYSFRQVLGKLTYAYVLCRPDIGYAVTLLSHYSTAPHQEHYVTLK